MNKLDSCLKKNKEIDIIKFKKQYRNLQLIRLNNRVGYTTSDESYAILEDIEKHWIKHK